jgi:hypothetical protein
MGTDLETTAADVTHHWSTTCLNCGRPLSGPFCSHCGQRAIPPHPTTRDLAGDAYSELVGWDGKVADTIRLLLRHPGELLAGCSMASAAATSHRFVSIWSAACCISCLRPPRRFPT